MKHSCAYRLCPALVDSGERYCAPHKKQVAAEYDRGRRSDPNRRFIQSRRWKEFREAYLKLHPVCTCGRQAVMIHHPIPRRQGGDPYAEDNCRPLCFACHSRTSAITGERWTKR